jgi:hypothetical protein
VTLVKFRDDAFIGINEASKRGQKRGEAAFQPFHGEDLHELGEIYLALNFLLGPFAFVIFKGLVSSVFEIVRESTNRFVEHLVLDLVELVKERLGVRDFRELETLLP